MRIFYTFYGGVFHGVCMCVCVYVLTCIYTHIHTQLYMLCAESFQSCPTLCDPMDHSLPGSSVFGILQATTLEWISMPSSKGSSRPRDPVHILRLLHWQVDFLPVSWEGWRMGSSPAFPWAQHTAPGKSFRLPGSLFPFL